MLLQICFKVLKREKFLLAICRTKNKKISENYMALLGEVCNVGRADNQLCLLKISALASVK